MIELDSNPDWPCAHNHHETYFLNILSHFYGLFVWLLLGDRDAGELNWLPAYIPLCPEGDKMLIVSDTVLSENNAVKSCLSKRQSGIFRTLHTVLAINLGKRDGIVRRLEVQWSCILCILGELCTLIKFLL